MRISKDVLTVLSLAQIEGSNVVLTGQLDRKLYLETNKVLEAAGGKWNKKAKSHIFDGSAEDRMEQILLTGEVEIPKDEFNYFPTPSCIVDRLIELAQLDAKEEMKILEPEAGQGAIANRLQALGHIVDCYELMEANFEALFKNPQLNSVERADFLTVIEPLAKYDRVIMNPPFAKQADIKHVKHALKFLKEDGLLVSVMSSGVMFRENKLTKDFRALVEDRGGFFEELPEGAFKESGTMVNTVIVVIPA